MSHFVAQLGGMTQVQIAYKKIIIDVLPIM